MLIVVVIVHLARSQYCLPPVIISGQNAGAPSCPAAVDVKYNVHQIMISFTLAPQCGEGMWYRVAYLNMTDSSQQCPPNWSEYNHNGIRACRRPVLKGRAVLA